MGKVITSMILIMFFTAMSGCGPHENDPRYVIQNELLVDISFNSYNNGHGNNDFDAIIISKSYRINGGIITVDSVLFVRKSDNDSLIYRHERHGDDINQSNHFFNRTNWVLNKGDGFYYTVNEEDFDN